MDKVSTRVEGLWCLVYVKGLEARVLRFRLHRLAFMVEIRIIEFLVNPNRLLFLLSVQIGIPSGLGLSDFPPIMALRASLPKHLRSQHVDSTTTSTEATSLLNTASPLWHSITRSWSTKLDLIKIIDAVFLICGVKQSFLFHLKAIYDMLLASSDRNH